MVDGTKTRAELLQELTELREQVAGLRRERQEPDFADVNIMTAVVQASPLAIFILDLQEKVRLWNPAAEQMFGWQAAEVLGQPNPLVPTHQTSEYRHVRQKFLTVGELIQYETTRQHKDGSLLEVSISSSTLHQPDGSLIGSMAIVSDVTERRQMEKELRDNEARFRATFDGASVGICLTDIEGGLMTVNPAMCAMLGYAREELEMMNIHDLIHPDDWDAEISFLNGAPAQGSFEQRYVHRDGRVIWGSVSSSLLSDVAQSPLSFILHIQDISERKKAETALERQLERLNALRTIDQTIMGSLDLKSTLDVLLEQINTQLGMDASAILIYNEESDLLKFAASRGFHTQALKHTTLHMGEGFAGQVAQERRPLQVSDLAKDTRHFSRSPFLSGEGFISYFGIPLLTKGQVKGVLEIFHRSPFEPDNEWTSLMEVMAGLAAISIDNAVMFDGLQKSNADLEMAYDTTLEGWSHALDLRDRETEGHSRRVTELSSDLARAMGLGEREIMNLRRGALLHDIGKMGIPDTILLKPDQLDPGEWLVMRRHPQLAFDLLSPIKYLAPALDIPYCHHERWDGSGYPRGLRAEQIPLAARIFSIADVYDALSSNRPYRSAWNQQKTIDYICSMSGKHFEPRIVKVFLELMVGEHR